MEKLDAIDRCMNEYAIRTIDKILKDTAEMETVGEIRDYLEILKTALELMDDAERLEMIRRIHEKLYLN